MALGLTTLRFDIAYCAALYLAINAIGSFLLGAVPEGSATERGLGWTSYFVVLIAPVVLWRTRNTRAGPHLQAAFIVLAVSYVVAAIAFS